MRLRLQLTLVFGAFIAVILSAVAISVFFLTERSLNAGVVDQAQTALAEITSGTSTIPEGLQKLPSNAYYQIQIVGGPTRVLGSAAELRTGVPYAQNSRILQGLSDAALQRLFERGELSTTVTLNDQSLAVQGRLGWLNDLSLASPGRVGRSELDQDRSFQVVSLVGIPANLMTLTLDQLKRDLIITVLIAFFVFALGVWLLSERVLASLKSVTEAAGHVSGSDLSRRVPVPDNKDEIRDLAVSINHMLDRLQESFETQRRFTADASHELRTPVTAIGGHASYLLRRTHPTEIQIDSLKVIQREGERMTKLVNDLLELARADAGFTVDLQPMNLVEVAETVAKELLPAAGPNRITVHSSTPLAEIEGDPERLKQVVLNLVQNALNAGARNVTITITVERNQVRLEVLDDGSGIPPEALPYLFDRFYRVDGARSVRGNGSGLGLSIVRWLVQQHGGTVEVESRVGEGSVFTILLPAASRSVHDTSAAGRASTIVEGLKTWAGGSGKSGS